jgi:cytochrome c-type biogenesis protein CcmH/NrfG
MSSRGRLPLVAAGLAAAVYLNALDNPFVYDDRVTVLDNPSLVDLRNWRFVLVYSLFRPLVNVSYAVDAALWGFRPLGFHLTNLALHALNVALLFRLVWHAVGDTRARTGRRTPSVDDEAARAAFAAAAVWAVHPVMTEAVGYVSGRSELLCATFFLSAWLLLRRGLVETRPASLAAGVAAFLAALASREVAVAFPFVFFAYDRWCLGGTVEERRRRLWRLHVPLASLVMLAAVARLSTLVLAERPVGDPLWSTLLTQTTVLVRYLSLLALPVGQSIVHQVRQITRPTDAAFVASAAVLLALAVAAWRLRRRAPVAAVGIVWFFLVLLPSSSVVALRESMAEHRVYLAGAGVFAGLASALAGIAARATAAGPEPARPDRRWIRRWRWGLATVVAGLAVLTVQRNRVWDDPVTLWAEAAARAPAYWEAHYGLADALREQGRCADAVAAYRAVLALRPGHRDALNNLGICLAETGDRAGARAAFERALAVDPHFARAETNLGTLALLDQDPARARAHFERALELDPRNLAARRQLAALFETTFRDPAAAARLCREILALSPRATDAAACVARNEAAASRPERPRAPR